MFGICPPPHNPPQSSELLLRRAQLVLAWTLHFYIHISPNFRPKIPAGPLAFPLLPITLLYDWGFSSLPDRHGNPTLPTISKLDANTLLIGTR